MDELEAVAGIADPGERARRAGELITEHQRVILALAEIRRPALE